MSAIAIDGPAGAGKSTIAKLLAKQLGYVYRCNVQGNGCIFFTERH